MGRGRWKKKFKENLLATAHEEGDPDLRLISLHPSQPLIAVAAGPSIRISNYETGLQTTLPSLYAKDSPTAVQEAKNDGTGGSSEVSKNSIRVLAFSPNGRFLFSGGDDKLATLWDCATWRHIASWKTVKKISAGAVSKDSRFVFFADKFGEVLVGDAAAAVAGFSTEAPAAAAVATAPLGVSPITPRVFLGHFCAIVSSLNVSPDNRFLVSTDKDFKTRVSVIPHPSADASSSSDSSSDFAGSPMNGSYEVQSYCLGHTSFVTSSAFVAAAETVGAVSALVTCGGDGTVRLWDHLSGELLDTAAVSEPLSAEAVSDEGEDGSDDDEDSGEPEEDEEQEAGCKGGAKSGSEKEKLDGLPTRQSITALQCRCRPAVFVAAHPLRGLVAVAVEGEDHIQLLRVVDSGSGEAAEAGGSEQPLRLRFAPERQRLTVPGLTAPCQVAFDCRQGSDRLFILGGLSVKKFQSLHIAAMEFSAATGEYVPAADMLDEPVRKFLEQREREAKELGQQEAFRQQEKRRQQEKSANPADADADVEVSCGAVSTLQKRQYTEAERSLRKKGRRDIREGQRLNAGESGPGAEATAGPAAGGVGASEATPKP